MTRFSLLLFATILCFGSPFKPQADEVVDWNNAALDAIRASRATPQFASRNLAMMHAAVYDAVNAIENSHLPFLSHLEVASSASREAAVASAAHTVLTNLFPSQLASLDAARVRSLSRIAEGPNKEAGIQLGTAAGRLMNQSRQADGSTNVVVYTVTNQPGRWRPTPPANAAAQLPQWPFVKPFVLPKADLFRPAGPVSLSSSQWTFDFNQVKSLGDTNSTTRTPDQTQIARFWLDGAGTMTPPGHWNLVAQNVASARTNSLSQNARLFALLNLAMADAAIAAWDAKYNTFPFWRPITAIREADTDGNPDTIADPNWTPLVATPPHPDYVSGHATFSGAAARILAGFFAADDVPFSVVSDDLPGVSRNFSSFSDCMREIGMSRIYAGIHTLTPIIDGFALGRSVANYTIRNQLLPTDAAPSFGAVRTRSDGVVEFDLKGSSGDSAVVESSVDLLKWETHQSLALPATGSIDTGLGGPRRFLRAVRTAQGF